MANHVTSWITVEKASSDVFKKLQEMFGGTTEWNTWDSMKFYNTLYPEFAGEDLSQINFNDQMGAKWCYVEYVDCSDTEFNMTTISAWDWSSGAFKRLHKILNSIDDEDVILTATYEDEGYNFVGAAAIKNTNELHDYSDSVEYPDDDDNEETMNTFYEMVGDIIDSCRGYALEDISWTKTDEEE
jgi:hypothetical protein